MASCSSYANWGLSATLIFVAMDVEFDVIVEIFCDEST